LKSADAVRIEEAFSVPAAVTVPQARVIQNPRLAWIVAAITTLVFASLAIVRFREKPAAASPEMRLEINTPSTPAPLNFALSPDGQHIVFAASGEGRSGCGCNRWIRPTRILCRRPKLPNIRSRPKIAGRLGFLPQASCTVSTSVVRSCKR